MYERGYLSKLRSDRDDALRAQAFDEAYPLLSEGEKEYCDLAIQNLMVYRGLGKNGARALLIELILYCHMKPDEQDRRNEMGEVIRSEREWSMIKHNEEEAML